MEVSDPAPLRKFIRFSAFAHCPDLLPPRHLLPHLVHHNLFQMGILGPDPGIIGEGMFDQDHVTPTLRVIAKSGHPAMGNRINGISQVSISTTPAIPIFTRMPDTK